jgi:DUF3072 family protein
MTGAQASYLKTLSEEAGDVPHAGCADASQTTARHGRHGQA